MKHNSYVCIDAHIIRCRLHHKNNNKYSVALKSGKDQQISTNYQSVLDNIVNMDTHLTLYADKHSYQHFPKLTLIVSATTQNGEKKVVGTTFVNYKKEGLQICQVSECSCKDKAFEIEVSFAIKLLEAKNSKTKSNKSQLNQENKQNFYSQQPTPRQSRQIKNMKLEKQVDNLSRDSYQKNKLKQIKSQKHLSNVKKQLDEFDRCSIELNTKREITQFEVRVVQLEKTIEEYEVLLSEEREQNLLLEELLALEEEKSNQAIKYVKYLENVAGMSKEVVIKGKSSSFKVIEEKDEIIEINEELHTQLLQEKAKNMELANEVKKLREQLNRLENQLNKQKKSVEQISVLKLKSHLDEPTKQNNILLASRCKTEHEKMQEEKNKKVLDEDIISLDIKREHLKKEINELEKIKQTLEKQIVKFKSQNKIGSPSKPPLKKVQQRKNQKVASKDKYSKPPLKTAKKSSLTPTNNTSSFKSSEASETPKKTQKKSISVTSKEINCSSEVKNSSKQAKLEIEGLSSEQCNLGQINIDSCAETNKE